MQCMNAAMLKWRTGYNSEGVGAFFGTLSLCVYAHLYCNLRAGQSWQYTQHIKFMLYIMTSIGVCPHTKTIKGGLGHATWRVIGNSVHIQALPENPLPPSQGTSIGSPALEKLQISSISRESTFAWCLNQPAVYVCALLNYLQLNFVYYICMFICVGHSVCRKQHTSQKGVLYTLQRGLSSAVYCFLWCE